MLNIIIVTLILAIIFYVVLGSGLVVHGLIQEDNTVHWAAEPVVEVEKDIFLDKVGYAQSTDENPCMVIYRHPRAQAELYINEDDYLSGDWEKWDMEETMNKTLTRRELHILHCQGYDRIWDGDREVSNGARSNHSNRQGKKNNIQKRQARKFKQQNQEI